VEEILIWVWIPFVLVWISDPRQVRHDQDSVDRQRKVRVSPDHADVGIVEPGAPPGTREAGPIIDGDGMVGDDELRRGLSRELRSLPPGNPLSQPRPFGVRNFWTLI
jgi:hypothetical protein